MQGLQTQLLNKWYRCLIHEPVLSSWTDMQRSSNCKSRSEAFPSVKHPGCLVLLCPSAYAKKAFLGGWISSLITELSHSPTDCLALSFLFPFTQLGSFSWRELRAAQAQVVNIWAHSKLKNLHLNKVKMGIRATSVTWANFHNIQLIQRWSGVLWVKVASSAGTDAN